MFISTTNLFVLVIATVRESFLYSAVAEGIYVL